MACVQLINALVSTPDDLDFRLHLRNEFIREGMSEPFQVCVEFNNKDKKMSLINEGLWIPVTVGIYQSWVLC